MCWIFAYKWEKDASELLMHWLVNLEYRGYDSAWICVLNKNGEIFVEKAVWKVSNLQTKLENDKKDLSNYHTWIAHTRWATHWGVTLENTHPHHSENGRFHVVHNWIIENFIELKKELSNNFHFYSDTDSEVVAKLIEREYEKDLLTTVKKVSRMIQGAYGLAVIDRENPDEIIWIKLGSPLVLGIKWETNFFISSDPNALAGVADKFIALDDHELVHIKWNDYKIMYAEFVIEKEAEEIEDTSAEYTKWDFEHFMLKEIHQMPEVFENSIRWKVDFEKHEINSVTLNDIFNNKYTRIAIIWAWTSYYSWNVWASYFEELSWIETHTYIAAEFKYKKQFINKDTLYIFISQSWETADTVDCLKLVKAKWAKTMWIVNVVGSTIARLADYGLYTHSWREVWVASTKAFTWNLWILITMALYLWNKNELDYTKYREVISWMSELKDAMNKVLEKSDAIKKIWEKYKNYQNMFFVGRNNLFPLAQEWSLKFKEITYNHTEAYPSGELKHGSLSLISEEFPSVSINPKWKHYDKNISTMKEISARNWKVIGVVTEWDPNADLYDDVIKIPETIEELTPFTISLALNLFAYHTANALPDRDIDKPRNLAKSVTVE